VIINWNGLRPVSATPQGCVINAPVREGFGFGRTPRINAESIFTKIGIALGSFALAGVSALGLVQAGYDEHTAAAVTVAAGKVSAAATVAVYAITDRRRREQFRRAAQRPAPAPDERVPPSPTAPAGDQPEGAS
jgi:hypothetical protein